MNLGYKYKDGEFFHVRPFCDVCFITTRFSLQFTNFLMGGFKNTQNSGAVSRFYHYAFSSLWSVKLSN
jgi:hypothetical protein